VLSFNPLEWLAAVLVGVVGLLPAVIATVKGRVGGKKSARF
jgi:hypothetical protein